MDSNQQTNRLSENSDAIFKTLLAEAKESMAEIEVVGASSAPDFHALIKAARRSFLATRTLSARLGVRFTRLEWDALLTFAEAWSNVVRVCNLPQGVLSKLPFKEIDIQLGTLLMHRFNLERILDLRQRFVQLKLKFLEEITISGEYRARWDALNAGWSQFEKTVSTTLRLSSDPDSANQISYLERLLQQFENTLNAHLGQLEKKGDKQSTKSDEKKDPLTFIQLQRDLSSVTRILQYVDLALRESVSASSSNAEQEKHQRLSRHLLERALQVIGESIKDTQQSSNLSTRTRTKLANAGVPLKKLESLRNRLSHFSGIHVGQRLSTEARITATLSVHELGKLRGVLQKSFDRLQFLMLKQVALGFYGRQREDQLDACKNVEDLLAEIPDGHGDDDYRAQLIALRDMAAIKSRMESLELATFKAQSQTENMLQQHSFVEWNLGEMKECTNTDMNEGFGRRRTIKSTITKVSEFVGISALDDVGGGAVSNSIVPSKDAAEDSDSSSFEEFVSTGISIFFTQDQFESISTAVGLGLEPELDEYTIYEVEDELSISEEQLQALHLLNKVKYIWRLIDASKETHELLDTRSKDALIRLVESAREGQVTHLDLDTAAVQQLSIRDEGQVSCLARILQGICASHAAALGGAAVDSVDNLLDAVCADAGIPQLTERVRQDREYCEQWQTLLDFLRAKSGDQRDSMCTRPAAEAELLEKCRLQFLKNNSKESLTDNISSCKVEIAKKAVKVVEKCKPAMAKLREKLGAQKLFRLARNMFVAYLKNVDGLRDGDLRCARSAFETIVEERLETFAGRRRAQLVQILLGANVLKYGGNADEELTTTSVGSESHRVNRAVLAAVEMLLLDCSEVYTGIYSDDDSESDRGGDEFHILDHLFEPVTSSTSLRHYLAHGIHLADVLNPRAANSVLRSAVRLCLHGDWMLHLIRICRSSTVVEFLRAKSQAPNELDRLHGESLGENRSGGGTQQDCEAFKVWFGAYGEFTSKRKQILRKIFASAETEPGPYTTDDGKGDFLGNECLVAAVNGDVDKLKRFLKMASDKTPSRIHRPQFSSSANGWTTLHHVLAAADSGGRENTLKSGEVQKSLLDSGADPNAADSAGVSPLHVAALNCKYSEALLEHPCANWNATVNDAAGGAYVVHIAALRGDFNLISRLRQKLDVNARTRNLWTALHFAIAMRREDTVRELLQLGANPNLGGGGGGWTPLHVAIGTHCEEGVLQALLSARADPRAPLADTRWLRGQQPLHMAAIVDNVDAARLLLDECRLSVDTRTVGSQHSMDQTALHLAAASGSGRVLQLLLEQGADVNAVQLDHMSALVLAVRGGYHELARQLLAAGASVDPKLILTAVNSGDLAMVKFLSEECQADVTQRTTQMPSFGNYNLLEIAACQGHSHVLDYLLEKQRGSSSATTSSVDLFSALVLACRSGKLNVVRNLLARDPTLVGSRTNCSDDDENGLSLLQIAACSGWLSVVNFLVRVAVGVGPNDVPSHGGVPSAALLAARSRHWPVVAFLKSVTPVPEPERAEIVHRAARAFRWKMVRTLVNEGWDFTATFRYSDERGVEYAKTSVAGVAATAGNLQMLQFLIDDHEFDACQLAAREFLQDLYRFGTHSVLAYLAIKGLDLNAKENEDGVTGFHCAAMHGNQSACEFFLEADVNVNLKTRDGKTPLHYAILGKQLDTVKFLVEKKGADVMLDGKPEMLLFAFGKGVGTLDISLLLLEYTSGACKLDDVDGSGNSALHFYLCQIRMEADKLTGGVWSHPEIMRCLCNRVSPQSLFRVNVNAGDDGESVFHLAVEAGCVETCKLIYAHAARDPAEASQLLAPAINAVRAQDGLTPLMLAVQRAISTFEEHKTNPTTARDPTLLPAFSVLEYFAGHELVDLNARSGEGNTALHLAAASNWRDIVHPLLTDAFRANPFLVNYARQTPREIAARLKRDFTATLEEYERDYRIRVRQDWTPEPVDMKPFVDPPLHRAARMGDVKSVEQCLKQLEACGLLPTALNAFDCRGRSALHEAAACGHTNVLALLVARGANVNSLSQRGGQSPLHFACGSGHLEAVKFLIRSRASPHVFNADGDKPVHKALEAVEVVKYMFEENHASLETCTEFGVSPLEVAASAQCSHTLEYLCTKFPAACTAAAANVLVLNAAVCAGSGACVTYLLRAGHAQRAVSSWEADAVSRDSRLKSPLRLAVVNHEWDAAYTLLDALPVDSIRRLIAGDGTRLLTEAAFCGQTRALRILIEKGGVCPHLTDANGWTPLLYAVSVGQVETVRTLLDEARVNPDAKVKSGDSGLHLAARLGHHAVLRTLLERGAAVATKDACDRTALECSAASRKWDVVDLFLQHDANLVHTMESSQRLEYRNWQTDVSKTQ